MTIKKIALNQVNFASVESQSTWLAPFDFSDYITLVDEFEFVIRRLDRYGLYKGDTGFTRCFNPAIQLDYICQLLVAENYITDNNDTDSYPAVLKLDKSASKLLNGYFKLLTGVTGNNMLLMLVKVVQSYLATASNDTTTADLYAVSIKEMSATCAKRAKKYASIIHQFTK